MLGEGEFWHVIPRGDFREHKASRECWCKPFQDDEEDNVYIHNALDQRERYEGKKLD